MIEFLCLYVCCIGIFSVTLPSKQSKKTMGLGSYWVRKDDQTGEAKTLKPWEEKVSNGDKHFPDPKGNPESPDEAEQSG